MKAKELRIGNYVDVPKDGQCPFRIDQIEHLSDDFGKFAMVHDKGVHPLTWYLKDLKPIPLTEEWLIKFGFKKHKGNVFENIILPYWVKNSVLMFFNIGQEEYSWKIGLGEMHAGKYIAVTFRWINEVHTLQNIYRILTGKELTINETVL